MWSRFLNRRWFLQIGVSAFFARHLSAQELSRAGVIFVGASWCPVCKLAAPMLASFGQQHGLEVLVASTDGRPIVPFEDFVDSKDHPIASKVISLPTTLIYSSEARGIVYAFEGYKNPRWYLTQLSIGLARSGRLDNG